jgi:hypothetical protein
LQERTSSYRLLLQQQLVLIASLAVHAVLSLTTIAVMFDAAGTAARVPYNCSHVVAPSPTAADADTNSVSLAFAWDAASVAAPAALPAAASAAGAAAAEMAHCS